MRKPSSALAYLLTPLAIVAQQPQPTTPLHHLVEVRVSGPGQLRALQALDLDLAGCQPPLLQQRRVEVIATDDDITTLLRAGFPFTVVQRDLEAHYAAQAARFPTQPEATNPPLGQGGLGGHWTWAQMVSILDDLNTANPAICAAKVSIGSTIEGRPLWMVKISDNVGTDEGEPEVYYDAMHHAREPLSMEATVVFMEWLVTNYGTDPLATFLVDERELFFVPCVNPDGYEYNRQINPGGGGMWRKNRRVNGDGTFGVDLNRNYATGWSAPNGGNSTATNSDTYRGAAPFSEPETQAIEAFVASRNFVSSFSTHTYTDVLLRPWGYQSGSPANAAEYDSLGAYYTVENGLDHGQVSDLLYIAAGGSVDHHHVVHGHYSWTAELGRSNEGGFWPAGQTIVDIAMRHQPMFRKVAATAGTLFDVLTVTVAEGPGGNGNGRVEVGENGTLAVAIKNQGIGTGSASLALSAVSAGVAIQVGGDAVGPLARFATGSSNAVLAFAIPSGYSAPTARLRLLVTGDGLTSERLIDLQLVAPRTLVADDFEQDRGFTRGTGTATTGLWERNTTAQTTNGGTVIQPGSQTTPGGSRCWVTDGRAGTGAGTYDVDGGFTDLLSPVIDLRHASGAAATFDLWYAESVGNDAMEIAVSRDGGGSWSTALSRSTSTGAWLRTTVELGTPLTDRMRLRFRAQDLNASLVECLIDGFRLEAVAADGAITALASGAQGSSLRLGIVGPPNSVAFALLAPAVTGGVTFPGIGGTLFVDAASAGVVGALLADAQGQAGADVAIPVNPVLSGVVFHAQAATLTATAAAFGPNVVAVTLQ
ncbi:MAG: hypothetical protein IPK26_29445 [Planctomycetes bacterium]|nr:hypothetical protein [Planctomycetota bacterium]